MTRERAEWELFGTDWYETFDAKKTEQTMLADADLLPVPKAGAAAGPGDTPADAPAPSAQLDKALDALAAAQQRPIEVHTGAQTIHVQPASVEIHQGGAQVHMPDGLVQLDAHIEQPAITVAAPVVNLDVAPAPVTVVQPQRATRQTVDLQRRRRHRRDRSPSPSRPPPTRGKPCSSQPLCATRGSTRSKRRSARARSWRSAPVPRRRTARPPTAAPWWPR
jgi:hypothetical protein